MSPGHRCLITGAAGFIGSYLAELLLGEGQEVYGTVHRHRRTPAHLRDRVHLIPCNLLERRQVAEAFKQARPAVVYHLAAQSLPLVSWERPAATFRANALGTLNVLQVARELTPDAVIVVAGSSAEYGSLAPEAVPVHENAPLLATSPYGISKVAADLLAGLFARAYGLHALCARPFFVTGPGKTGDVCSDIARGIAAVERGRQRTLRVGNLEAVRDFLDVRDAVRALHLLADKGGRGEAYNICSGQGRKISGVLSALLSMAVEPVPVVQDEQRLRPLDEPVVIGDNSRLRALGWQPEIALDETLSDVLAYWRALASETPSPKRRAGSAVRS